MPAAVGARGAARDAARVRFKSCCACGAIKGSVEVRRTLVASVAGPAVAALTRAPCVLVATGGSTPAAVDRGARLVAVRIRLEPVGAARAVIVDVEVGRALVAGVAGPSVATLTRAACVDISRDARGVSRAVGSRRAAKVAVRIRIEARGAFGAVLGRIEIGRALVAGVAGPSVAANTRASCVAVAGDTCGVTVAILLGRARLVAVRVRLEASGAGSAVFRCIELRRTFGAR